MNDSDMPIKSEAIASAGLWTTPTSHSMRPRPATIHEGFSYSMGEDYGGLSSWDPATLPLQETPSDTMSSRPISSHQEFYTPTHIETNPWNQKPYEDSFELSQLDGGEIQIGQAYTTDEAIPIMDLRYQGQPPEGESLCIDNNLSNRRMSGSSFTMSTSGGLSDMPSYEDFSAALSEAPTFGSDYPPPSNRNSLMSSTQLSPVASPRMTPQGRSELARTHSRGRASPSPRPGIRAAPYSVETARNKRWSTGSYGPGANRRPSPLVYHPPHDIYGVHQRMSSRHSSPTIPSNHLPLNFGNLQAAQQHHFLVPGAPMFHRNSMLLPSQLPSQLPSNAFHPDGHHHFEAPPPLLSHGLFRMLQSNADPHALHGHYTDLSEPPDLYASLHEEQIPPPPEDMEPSDPDLVPHEQELRFEGDLYTPRWVRGHGNKREGWCGICKPGRWLVLKNSAFWYDKSFTHGISAATGSPFQEPHETRRMDGNPDVWEGLCGGCNDWIALCHTHPKIKDGPKRRRESTSRTLAVPPLTKLKSESEQAEQPQQPQQPQQQQQQQQQQQPPLTPTRMVPVNSIGHSPRTPTGTTMVQGQMLAHAPPHHPINYSQPLSQSVQPMPEPMPEPMPQPILQSMPQQIPQSMPQQVPQPMQQQQPMPQHMAHHHLQPPPQLSRQNSHLMVPMVNGVPGMI
ncbi:uncharacterized protein DNG_01396 [Cephalotrichum gorgonifer]|uniref:Transcription regulator Rua1 C-terminal domain-containing protein n=1 Tax=Cephalotrichum gorgonifer TaxID=2041049 RepID=A0AAE8MSZ2_9PEZI|nr:uncharacterized protein DNG_01396 [Cephalotrichum gorgonifer]